MNFLDYLNLLRRRLLTAIILIIVVMGTTLALVGYKNMKPYQTTVFISIGSNQGTAIGANADPSYENVQAADHFSETVQGWFKNPDFQERISFPGTSEANARKQEKQNILVTFTNQQSEEGALASEKIKSELEKELTTYNTKTNSDFRIAIFSVDTEQKPLSIPLFMIVSLIGGLMVASFALYGYEYLFQKVSSPSRAEELLQKPAIELLSSVTSKKLHFVIAHLQKEEWKNIQIVGLGVDVKPLTKQLQHSVHGKTLTPVNFPEDSMKISAHDHQLLVCALGRASLRDLRKVQTLLSASFDLVIVEA